MNVVSSFAAEAQSALLRSVLSAFARGVPVRLNIWRTAQRECAGVIASVASAVTDVCFDASGMSAGVAAMLLAPLSNIALAAFHVNLNGSRPAATREITEFMTTSSAVSVSIEGTPCGCDGEIAAALARFATRTLCISQTSPTFASRAIRAFCARDASRSLCLAGMDDTALERALEAFRESGGTRELQIDVARSRDVTSIASAARALLCRTIRLQNASIDHATLAIRHADVPHEATIIVETFA